jgi:hypothetical protein
MLGEVAATEKRKRPLLPARLQKGEGLEVAI